MSTLREKLSKLNPNNFTKKAKIIFWVVIVIAIILIGYLLYAIASSTKELENESNKYVVTVGDITQTVTGSGTCQPSDITTLVATVNGEINYINYDAGSIVGEGDVIVAFKTTDLDYALDKAQLAYDQAKYEYNNAPEATKKSAKVAMETAQIEVDSVNSQYNMYRVSSPLSGSVLEVKVKPEQYVTAGTEVAVVANTGKYEVEFTVDENFINQITVGQQANISIPSASPSDFQGVVTDYSLIGDTSTSGLTTYLVTVTFDIPADTKILDGMNSNISIIVSQKNGVMVIPENAVNNDGTVTVIDEENDTTENVAVELGTFDDNNIEVISGLNVGDTILVNN